MDLMLPMMFDRNVTVGKTTRGLGYSKAHRRPDGPAGLP
jgi:hypothetical protein